MTEILGTVLAVLRANDALTQTLGGPTRIYRGNLPPKTPALPALVVSLISRNRPNWTDTDYVEARVQISVFASTDCHRGLLDDAVVRALNRNTAGLNRAGACAVLCEDAGGLFVPAGAGSAAVVAHRDFRIVYHLHPTIYG